MQDSYVRINPLELPLSGKNWIRLFVPAEPLLRVEKSAALAVAANKTIGAAVTVLRNARTFLILSAHCIDLVTNQPHLKLRTLERALTRIPIRRINTTVKAILKWGLRRLQLDNERTDFVSRVKREKRF